MNPGPEATRIWSTSHHSGRPEPAQMRRLGP
jgi:hypothetical protein